jgi:hypothetical protein
MDVVIVRLTGYHLHRNLIEMFAEFCITVQVRRETMLLSVAFVGTMPVLLVKFKHLVHVPNAEIKQNIIQVNMFQQRI